MTTNKSDIENFLSDIFGSNFSYEECRYTEKGEWIRPPYAYDRFCYKINDKYYELIMEEKDDAYFILVPLKDDIIKCSNDKEKIVYVIDSLKEDKDWNNAINLSSTWIEYESIKHPELIEKYENTFIEKIDTIEKKKKELDKKIGYYMSMIKHLEDLKPLLSKGQLKDTQLALSKESEENIEV